MAPGIARGVGGGFVKRGWQTCVSGRPRPRGRADPAWREGAVLKGQDRWEKKWGGRREELPSCGLGLCLLRVSLSPLWWRGVPHTLSESWERGCLN